MYYSAGVGSLTSFAAAVALPPTGWLWLMAKILLYAAGGLFGLYLAVLLGLLVIGRVVLSQSPDRSP